jgi:hypothetical protein
MGDKKESPVSPAPVMTRGLCTVDVWIRVSWKGTVRITTGDVLQHSSHTQITQITPEALGYRNCGSPGGTSSIHHRRSQRYEIAEAHLVTGKKGKNATGPAGSPTPILCYSPLHLYVSVTRYFQVRSTREAGVAHGGRIRKAQNRGPCAIFVGEANPGSCGGFLSSLALACQ